MTETRRAAPRIPFDVVDEAVHVLDREAEPWSIQLEVRLPGTVDEARLRRAVVEALARHPGARARKVATARRTERRYHWEVTEVAEVDPVRVVDCPADEDLVEARSRLLDLSVPLSESPPLRLRLARRPGGDVVMVNVNHAASDGVGSLRFLQSVSRAYAGRPDPTPDVDPLRARDLGAAVGSSDLRTRLLRGVVLAEKLRDLVAPPSRIAPDQGTDRPGYGFHFVRLDTRDTARLADAPHRGTVNDVLLAALHLTVDAWNRDHGAPPRRIGAMVPMNLRPAQWRWEVMGNLFLPVRVATDRHDRSSPESALEAVTAQTRRFKESGTGPALLELLRRSPSLPLGAKEATSPLLWLTGNRLLDTTLLTNLGQLDDPPTFGESPDEVELLFSAPARMPLGLSLGAVTVGGRLHLAFRYRHPLLGPGPAQSLAQLYVSVLERFLAR